MREVSAIVRRVRWEAWLGVSRGWAILMECIVIVAFGVLVLASCREDGEFVGVRVWFVLGRKTGE